MTIKTRNIADAAVTTGKLANLTVTTANLAVGALTLAKLNAIAATFGKGIVQLPLADWRAIATNDIPVIAGTPAGGIMAKNSVPIFERVNAATDKLFRLTWAPTTIIQIATQFAYPPDLDDASNVEIHVITAKDADNNTVSLTMSYFENSTGVYAGDTDAGPVGQTIAAAATEMTFVVAASDIGPAPAVASIGFTLGAHAGDTAYLYAAWVEYTRK